MRISQDDTSWRASGIVRRDFRHTHGEPEVYTGKARRKKQRKKKAPRVACKHVWVNVSYAEYIKYADRWRWYYFDALPYWSEYTTYFVCAGCLETKSKRDKGRERVYWRRQMEKRRRERARAS